MAQTGSDEAHTGWTFRAIVPLLPLLVIAAASVWIAYQTRPTLRMNVGGSTESYLAGFYYPQTDSGHEYRWSKDDAAVRFPDAGESAPLALTISANAWRQGDRVFTATVTLNGHPVGEITKAGWRTWRFVISDPTLIRPDQALVGIHAQGFVPNQLDPASSDVRQLGIAVEYVELAPAPSAGAGWLNSVVNPPAAQVGFAIVLAAGAYFFGLLMGLSRRETFALALALVILFSLAIIFDRTLSSERYLFLALAGGAAATAGTMRLARPSTGALVPWQSLSRMRLRSPSPPGPLFPGPGEEGERKDLSVGGHPPSSLSGEIPLNPKLRGYAKSAPTGARRILVAALPITVAVVALALRWNAIPLLPVEGDDGVHMVIAQHYAHDISSGNWIDVVQYEGGTGHPPFYELAFASSLIARDALGIPASDVETMRVLAALLGAAQAGLIALLNPLAGWFVAIQTTEIKFTSMAYLEALPALAMAGSVLAYERFRRTSQARWLYFSAFGLGITAASKFIYLAGGFAIAAFLLWEQRKQPRRILAYGIVAVAVFVLASPYFWADTIVRLRGMFSFHLENSTRPFIQQVDRPWWYAWVVLANPGMIYSPPYEHPAYYVMVWDGLIYVLGLLGLPSLARRSWLYLAWFVAGMVFLALWEAKWEQYAMIVAAPLCLAAGYFVLDAVKWLQAAWNSRRVAVHAAPPAA